MFSWYAFQPFQSPFNNSVNKDGTTRFEDHIKLRHLKELMQKFDAHEPTNDMPPDGYYTPGRIIKRESGNVTVKEFKEMIQSMLRTNSWDTQMESLFTKVWPVLKMLQSSNYIGIKIYNNKNRFMKLWNHLEIVLIRLLENDVSYH